MNEPEIPVQRRWSTAEIMSMAVDHIPHDEYPFTIEEVKQLDAITELIRESEKEVIKRMLKGESEWME
jgi:hypothetical protein